MASRVLLRGIFTIFLRLSEQKRHASIILVQQLIQMHALLLLFIEKYP